MCADAVGSAWARGTPERVPLYWRIGNVLVSYATYLRQFFWPTGLALWHPFLTSNLPAWKILGGLVLLTVVTAGALVGWRRYPYVLVGWLWYLGMLVPVIGFVQLSDQAMADRYTYLPQIGICIALVWGLSDQRWGWLRNRWMTGVSTASVLAMLMGCAWRQASFWHDSETLWTRTLACTTRNCDGPRHARHPWRSVGGLTRRSPSTGSRWNSIPPALGLTATWVGLWPTADASNEAIAAYQKALAIKPDSAEAHNNLGNILAGLGHVEEAIAHFQEVLKIEPDSAEAHNNLGAALGRLGRFDETVRQCQRALAIRPDFADAHNNLGGALAGLGRVDEAIAHYQQALEIQPDFADAHNNLGGALAGRGQFDEAIAHFQRAMEVRPGFVQARRNLGIALSERERILNGLTERRDQLRLRRTTWSC